MSMPQESTNDAKEMSVAVLGLGSMGSAIALAYLKNGYKTTVWNRSIGKATVLLASGAVAADTAAECMMSSKFVIICLSDSSAVLNVLSGLAPLNAKDQTIVNFTTGSTGQIRQVQGMVDLLGFAGYISGAIETLPIHVGSPVCECWYSGTREAYAILEPSLEIIGRAQYCDDDACSAALQEVMLGTSMYALTAGFLSSVALLKTSAQYTAGKTTVALFMERALRPTLLNTIQLLDDMAQRIDAGDHASKGDGASLNAHSVALQILKQTFKEQNVSSVVLDPIQKLINDRLLFTNSDKEELSAVVEVLKA